MKKLLSLSLGLALMGAGCGAAPSNGAPNAGQPSRPSIAVGEPNPSAPSGNCLNAYFPSKKGFAITYKSSFGHTASEYKNTVTDVNADGLSVEIAFPQKNISMKQDYVCEGSKIRAKGYADLSSAMAGTKVTFETKAQDGLYLPEKLVVGAKWESSADVVGKIESGPLAQAGIRELKETISTKSEALAKEKVTVAAGTFDAIKVKQDTTVKVQMGTTNAAPITTTSYVWFVEGVGMVKSVSSVSGSTSTIEATEIQR
ncbi:MAG: hypothetical protein U0487_00255 [Patescibacteria group bacterium]